MSKPAWAPGDRVAIVSGKYAGLSGVVVDAAVDDEAPPAPFPGHRWVRVDIQNVSVPVHVHESALRRRST